MNRLARHPNFAPTALAIAISLATAQLHAADLPTGGNIIGGSGSISQAGNSLNVQQNSDKLITNWDSFNIGAGNTVNFHQPGSNSVALNRVIGEDASAIYGNLNANGKVFLVNPNGVLFGQGAAVNVGALVASTLSLSDQDFNDGNYQFQGNGNNDAVINRGNITADGGAVALLGGQVSNHGIIQANQGTVALAAGDKITLDFAGDGLLNVTVDEGTLNALVENHQLIRANGGQVVMTANATNALLQSVVNNTGIIEAQTLDNQSGTIVLKGGFNGGTVNVAGTLDASAPESGDGGFIDTSGAHVKVADGTQVTTKANNGSTGEWLIDPTDFYITDSNDSQTSSGIGAATLSANLENNNVTLETVDTGSEAGDMYVNGAVSWSANTTLTLNAHNDIYINQAISASNGGLNLIAGNQISADGAVNVGTFNLQSGDWSQLGSSLADFSAGDFRLNTANARFLRATGGDGSEGNAYQIFDLYGLQGIASHSLLSSHFALSNDIDASGTANWNGGAGFVPVGDGTNRYTGDFDGLGHSINGLSIDRSDTDFVGLFGATASGSVIRDIGLVGGSVSGRNHVGGLVGVSSGTVSNAYATGSVEGSGRVGGLIGFNQSGTINDAYATGSVKGSDDSVGGLVGYNQGDISNAYATGNVEGSNYYVGGLAGESAGNIRNAYATGSVNGHSILGGLVGYNSVYGTTIINAYATGNVEGSGDTVGGLVGWNAGNIIDAYATGSVEGYYRVGGLVAVNLLRSPSVYGSVINAYATGSVNGYLNVGGLVGRNAGDIINAYATGNVEGNNSVGGLVGDNPGDIINAYATGNVEGNFRVGGLVGHNRRDIINAYATGSVEGNLSVGGLVGDQARIVTDSYWNTDTSGQINGVGAGSDVGTTGLTTAQMMQANSFAGWDIDAQGGTDTVWRIYEGHTTPLLRSFLTALEVTGDTTTTTYNGTEQSGSWSATSEYDSDRIFGQVGGGRNAGTYNIDMNGLYSDQQGYDLITTSGGTLTINKAQATVTANSNTTTYNGTEQSVSGFTVDGLVNGEDQSVLTGVTTSGGTGTNAGSYMLTASGADGNYELTFVDGTLTINKAQATVTANSGTTTYNGTEQSGSGFTVEGLVNGEDQSVLTNVTVNGGGRNAGSYVLTASGSDGNYELTFVDGTLTIDRKTITADIRALDKLFDGSLTATLEGVLNGTISGDDVALQLSGLFASLVPGENRVLVDASLSGADAGNYQLVAPGEVIARLEGFVQTDDYQSAVVSQPQEQRGLSTQNDPRYQLEVDDDALYLSNQRNPI